MDSSQHKKENPGVDDLGLKAEEKFAEHKRAEEELERTRDMLAEAQKIAHLGSFEYVASTQTTVWSMEEYRIYGLDPAGPSPTYDVMLAQCIHPDDAALLHETFTKAMQSGLIYELEHRIVRPDGAVRWVYDRAQPYFDENQNLLRYVGTTLDITERKQVEEALRAAEELARQRLAELEDLYRNARVGLCVLDRDLRFLRINERLAEINGIPAADHIGKTVRELMPQLADAVEPSMRHILATGEPKLDIEIVSETPAQPGVQRSWLEQWLPVKDAEGRVVGLSIVVEETTARKQAEEALRKSQEDLDRAQAVGNIGSWRLDVQRNVLTWSDENHRIFGVPKGTPMSYETFLSIVHPDDREYVDTKWKTGIAGENYDIEHRIVTDGKIKWVREKAYLEFDKNGELVGGFGITQDITDRKQAEEELRKLTEDLKRSNSDLKQFAYIASHDLQSPLRNIEGFVKLLARRYRGRLDEKADQFIHYIATGVKDMQMLILDILEYSKLGSDGKTFKKTESSLCVAKAISNLNDAISEKNAVITVDEPFPVVFGDSVQLTSLFQNLISNAIKFCTQTPKIHLSVKREGSENIFSVRDNGIGVDAQYFDKIFVVFHRLHSKSEYPGTGIGLAICNQIVDRHGGRIWVESEPGQGSTFYFTMPALY